MPLLLIVAGATTTALIIALYLYTRLRVARAQVRWLQGQLQAYQQDLALSQRERQALDGRFKILQADHDHLNDYVARADDRDKAHRESMLLQFENLSNKLLEEKSTRFTRLNKQEIDRVLTPLAEKIKTFEQEIQLSQRQTRDQHVNLRTELERMHQLNARMTQETKDLTQAIKGDARTQGIWGEFILQSLLSNAGMTKGREYVVQQHFTDDHGQRLQPDVIIKLPQDRSIVIDAKASLRDYEAYCTATDPKIRQKNLKNHLLALKRHVKTLHDKNYAQQYDLHGLDFVLMFIPLEPAFTIALQHEYQLFEKAYHDNVIITAPSTLLATLRTIAHVWKRDYQDKNAMEIAQESGRLYDKFVSFTQDLKKLGDQLNTAQKTYDSAFNKLSEGQGNLIDKAQRIKALGARSKKQLVRPLNLEATP